jgi:branched-chain amino acid transport system substrate-binding protein
MVEYLDTVNQYYPEDFRPTNAIVGYGYTQAAMLVEALEQMEEPTRLALMESVRNLEATDVGLLLPGTTVATGEDDAYFGETLELAQYVFDGDASYFELSGEPSDFEGQTADLTPEELISG